MSFLTLSQRLLCLFSICDVFWGTDYGNDFTKIVLYSSNSCDVVLITFRSWNSDFNCFEFTSSKNMFNYRESLITFFSWKDIPNTVIDDFINWFANSFGECLVNKTVRSIRIEWKNRIAWFIEQDTIFLLTLL